MTDKQFEYRLSRLLAALRRHGWHSVSEAAAALDKDADYTSIKGVGVVLAEVMRDVLKGQKGAVQ